MFAKSIRLYYNSSPLKIAFDILLNLIDKGNTVAQVARVNKNLDEAYIMIISDLMKGFPTQKAHKTFTRLLKLLVLHPVT